MSEEVMLSEEAWRKIIIEDIQWVKKQEPNQLRSLEAKHIIALLGWCETLMPTREPK